MSEIVTATLQVTVTLYFVDDGEMELEGQAIDAMREQWSELGSEASVDRVWIESGPPLPDPPHSQDDAR